MTNSNNKDHMYFNLAFDLAYFMHASKEIAFFIAEDALDELPLVIGKQKKNRKASRMLSGFWKGGERTRPIRQTIRLSETQMLQWLCYKQSESWERQTEKGEGLYSPTAEDMIVRYLGYLLFLTLRRGSFYVTLAIGQILHQFDRRETRLFYDVLTQSDSARMKDTGYIGKQRLQLLGRICDRFDKLIQVAKTPGGETQIVAQPMTQRLIDLVSDCLRRFSPWDTTCIIESGFDVTDIPGFYSAGSDIDEDKIEVDRLHTVVDPVCFDRFVRGLAQYARALPDDSQDRFCNFDSSNSRLAVPQFLNTPGNQSRGDRSKPPTLSKEDYIRLGRTLDARARRRTSFSPKQISAYVDSRMVASLDLHDANHLQFFVGSDAGIIEVRGRDDDGELTLATLPFELNEIPAGETFKDSVVDRGGQKLGIQLTPFEDSEGVIEGARVRLTYSAPRRKWLISKLARYPQEVQETTFHYLRWLTVGLTTLLVGAAAVFIWSQLQPTKRVEIQPVEQVEKAPSQDNEPPKPAAPGQEEHPRESRKEVRLIARASWSTDPQTVLQAVSIEPTRGEVKSIDLSRRQAQIFLSIPQYDDNRTYERYRIKLGTNNQGLWQQTLRAPAKGMAGNAHILSVVMDSRQLIPDRMYTLRIEGWARDKWTTLGQLSLNPKVQ